jgi:hypothetical protein
MHFRAWMLVFCFMQQLANCMSHACMRPAPCMHMISLIYDNLLRACDTPALHGMQPPAHTSVRSLHELPNGGGSGVLKAGASEPHTEGPPLLAGGFRQYAVSEGPANPPARTRLASGNTVPEAPRLPEAASCNWVTWKPPSKPPPPS